MKRFKFNGRNNCIEYDNKKVLLDDGGEDIEMLLNSFQEHNEALKKEIYLVHMRLMFSTVKSFKGDISKRYEYDEETDTIYDTANHYGQYAKVLDKKEITMLLNEYSTLLEEENQTLLHIIDWCLTNHKEIDNIVFNSRDEFFIWLKKKGVI